MSSSSSSSMSALKLKTVSEANPNDAAKKAETVDLGNGSGVVFIQRLIPSEQSWKWFHYLDNHIPWTRPTIRVFGKSFLQPRDTCYVASSGLTELSYSGYQPHAYSWDDYPPLKDILDAVRIAMLKNSCKTAIKELKHWMTPEKVQTSLTTFPASAEIVSEPLGVVLVISAWNYPFLLSLDPVIGAIAAGNAVVLKPSEIAPATSALLAKLVGEYMDNSSIRVVEGAVDETSALLQQKWDKIFYTGNGRVGRIVMAAAAKHLTPVVLELGGKSPVVVDSNSNINLQVTTRRIIAGKWGCNNGQACISPDYIITTKDYAPKLVDALKTELESFYGKNPLESKDLSRIVNSNHFARLTKLLDDDKVSGKIVHGGEKDETKL
ncbi:Aldehyde dehydrogenase 3 member H1 [Lathyrus oleraceus]|uniref:Aldehyde dehydrogenase 3 member H1 n=2 Tax=Pisum sativum TaxID=3888 RepID=A0A9D4Y847_PEA|nr:Aldehyde dehydrogenase 3 member H1 [Pisum sativum]